MQPAPVSPVSPSRGWYARHGKRVLDLVLGCAALAALSPLLALLALMVRIRLGSPVLFRQERPGLGGRRFTNLKFRSMSDARGPDGQLLPDAQRLDRFGSFLRAASLDELPQLLNVVRGDMSLVGPRPLLTRYLELYTPTQARRHEVRPGITGWAQINGRASLPWPARIELDLWYVDHRSVALDLRIVVQTIRMVFSGHGLYKGETGGWHPPA